MKFVLDNSIAMRWLLNDREQSTQDYARKILDLLIEGMSFSEQFYALAGQLRLV